MLKKNKKLALLLSGLTGVLLTSSAIGLALSSCSSTTSSSSSTDVQYSYAIDWDNKNAVDRLIIDDNGLVYSDNTKTTIIAVSPKVMLNTITIPSTVKNIAGYVKVTTNSAGIKVYQQVGAFQDNLSLNLVIIPTESKLQSIDAYAFKGCSNLRTISSTQNASALTYIGKYAFQGCSNLVDINLENITIIDDYAFNGAINRYDSQITLSLPNVSVIGTYAFAGSGVYGVDFSKNTSLYTIGSYAFNNATNLTGTIDLSGCSNLTQISSHSFAGCTNLVTVNIPSEENSNLKTISNNAFYQCTSMTTFGPKGTSGDSLVTTTKITTIGDFAFADTQIKIIDASKFTVGSSGHTGSTKSFQNMHYVTSVTLPEGMTTIPCTNDYTGGGYFYGIGDLGDGFSITLPSTITSIEGNNDASSTTGRSPLVGAFSDSGVKSIDMSKIKSYSTNPDSPNTIANCVFYGASKLETVVLKNGTTGFGDWVFSYCKELKWITTADANGNHTTQNKNGFVADGPLTFGWGVFQRTFPHELTGNVTIDLSKSGITEVSDYLFDTAHITEVKLPSTVETIGLNAFRNANTYSTSKLKKVNFNELINLTTIKASNFNESGLTNIDLSKCVNLATIDLLANSSNSNPNSFTNLLTSCTVLLPSNFTGNVSNIFTSVDPTKPVTINFPNGIPSAYVNRFVTNCVLKDFQNSTTNSSNLLKNASNLRLSSDWDENEVVWSIGQNTFFGSSKLSSIIWDAKKITAANSQSAAAGLFTTTASITPNNTNNTSTSRSYTANSVPFGNNEVFRTLNYNSFSLGNSPSTIAGEENSNSAQQALFSTTNNTTWEEVAKIINSLSYQTSLIPSNSAATLKPNMSTWTTPTSDSENTSGKPINKDVVSSLTNSDNSVKVTLTNSFAVTPPSDSSYKTNLLSSSDTSVDVPPQASPNTNIEILATDPSKKFVHNGITWTYTNDGSTIKLVGIANMYKLTHIDSTGSSGQNYLVFFNQTPSIDSTNGNVHYIPDPQGINVTLTIATTSSTK